MLKLLIFLAVISLLAAVLAPKKDWPKYTVGIISAVGLISGIMLWFASAYYPDPTGTTAGFIGEPRYSRLIVLIQWFGYSIPALGYLIGCLVRKSLTKVFVS